MNLIELKDISKSYETYVGNFKILKNINLQIKKNNRFFYLVLQDVGSLHY